LLTIKDLLLVMICKKLANPLHAQLIHGYRIALLLGLVNGYHFSAWLVLFAWVQNSNGKVVEGIPMCLGPVISLLSLLLCFFLYFFPSFI
jgi:hypothetical protein